MSGIRLFCVIFVCLGISRCNGITTYENEKNLIGEEERRGITVKEDVARVNDQKTSESTKRGLWLISQHQQPSGYDTSGTGGYQGSSGPGGYGYYDSGGYGGTGNGYNYGGGGGYHKGHSFGHGYGYTGGGSNFGYGGFGHGGYDEEPQHEVSQHHGGFNKLAFKKLLIPLAGLAILGAAAALSSNPVLLQLGTVQSGRKKRAINSENAGRQVYPSNPWTRPDSQY